MTRWAAEQRDMIGSMDGPGCRARARGFVVALAGEVVWANACTSTEPNDEQGGDRPPSPPTAEAVFERLLNEHQQVDDADWMIDPDDAYAVQLAEHRADLSECGFPPSAPLLNRAQNQSRSLVT